MAVHFSTLVSPRTLAPLILPVLGDQAAYRLFLSGVHPGFAPRVAVITGVASLLFLAKDRTSLIVGSILYLAYKTAQYYYFSQNVEIDRRAYLPPNSREAQLAALETLADLLLPKIEQNYLSTVGLYRESGRHDTIQEASACFQRKKNLPPLTDPHDMTGIFKAQLRTLNPSLLQPYYEKLKSAALKSDERKKRMAMILAFQNIQAEKPLLRKIIQHFNKIHENKEQTKMASANLAICITPQLFDFAISPEGLTDLGLFTSCLKLLIENPTVLS